jgi:ATP/maltotriose-dependent transcriptional regulator MalT/DNA-binding SARP family transcriptional activator
MAAPLPPALELGPCAAGFCSTFVSAPIPSPFEDETCGAKIARRPMALAKTTRPTLSGTVARTRLFRRLDHARQRPVTWVCGPPGAGKTTLVANYLAARKYRVLWYQVDGGDADVATFFYYLGRAAPRRARSLPLLMPEYRHGLTVFARRYFRDLYARLKSPFTVVFDNYQEVASDSPLHEVVAAALAEIPEGGRVIVVSRAEPPPAFARHRAQRMIALLDWPELRFTPAEAIALVQKLAPGRWSRQTIRSIHESVDGWAAGLVLRLEQARSEAAASTGPTQPSSEVLFDYFAGEIFKNADSETQAVLLQTAFLPRVTVAMAEALTGRPGAGDILAALHKQNYFTNKQTADGEVTYEYHPLFREFLLSRSQRVYAREARAKIRRAAADLLEAAGRVEAAAELLRDAEDWEGLVRLIYRHAQSLLGQGRSQTLEEWLDRVPPAIVAEQPWLLFWRGIGWMGWRHAESRQSLEQAFTAFRRQRDTVGMFLAGAGTIFACVSEGDVIPIDRWTKLLEEIMREAPFPSKGVETRVACAMLTAIVFRQPRHPQASRWAERAIELGRRHPDPALRTMAAVNWLEYQLEHGDLSEAVVVVDEMRVVMHAHDVSPLMVVNAAMTVAWYEALTAAPSYRRTVAQILELAQNTGMFYTARHVVLAAGLLGALSDGDLEIAGSWLRELERDVHLLGPVFRFVHHCFIVWEALVRGDVTRAVSYLPEMLRLAALDGRPLDEAVAHLMSAEALDARGDAREARTHLDRALEIARVIQSPYIEFMARLTEAHLCFDVGQDVEGLQALTPALALGRQRGYVNSHVWIPAVMARLCARALGAGIEVGYVCGLVEKRGLVPESPPVEVEAWPWPIKIFTLGRFEVLRTGEPVRFSRKVQRKPLALLKALIAFGGRTVREDLVMDALWPDAEGDAARVALASALHRLRGLLGREQAVVRQEGRLSLDARLCWVDVWAVERLLGRAETATRAAEFVRKAVELYRGAFLDERELQLPQAAALADGVRRRLLRQIVRVARHCEPVDRQEAVDWYEDALRVDPCAEDVYRSLMSAHRQLGRSAEVENVYRRCQTALAAHLGTTPSPETQALRTALRK